MNEASNMAFRARLEEMWQESTNAIAKAFVKRAIHQDMTLAQLQQVLDYGDARPHLHDIKLHDVLARQAPRNQPVEPQSTVRPVSSSTKKHRRTRKSSADIQVIKDALLERVQASVGGTNVKQLTTVLQKSGMSVDVLLAGRLLKALYDDGFLDCVVGKPNIWRGRTQGRRAPEPMIIRKASSNVS